MIKDFNYICGKILGISDGLEMQGDDISKRAAEKLRECVSDLDLCFFDEWKYIKTAPKNGSAFLGYNDKCIDGYEFQVWR